MTKKSIGKRTEEVLQYFEDRYGNNGKDLSSWQLLCDDIGVNRGTSLTQCKKNLKRTNINIIDFVYDMKANRKVHSWPSRGALAQYIHTTNGRRLFPLKQAKRNRFVEVLLIEVWG